MVIIATIKAHIAIIYKYLWNLESIIYPKHLLIKLDKFLLLHKVNQ